MSLLSTSYFLLPLRLPENEPPELAEEELVGRGIFGVGFEARALEVLHDVGLPVLQDLIDLRADRVAVDREVAVRLPVGEEAPAHAEVGLRREAALVLLRRDREGRSDHSRAAFRRDG